MGYKDSAGFLVRQLPPVKLHAHIRFNFCLMVMKPVEQFFIIGNMPFYYNLVILSNLIDTDMTGRRPYTQSHPMVRTCLSLIELLCECVILECIIIESNPIVISCLQRRRFTYVTLDFLCPVIRLFYHFKFNGNIRIADLIQFDLYKKENNIFIGVIIQPLNCRAMFFSCSLYNPNHNISRFAGRICNQFAKVVMVGLFKLILNNDFPVRSGLGCINVYIEISNAGLGFIDGYLQTNGVRQ